MLLKSVKLILTFVYVLTVYRWDIDRWEMFYSLTFPGITSKRKEYRAKILCTIMVIPKEFVWWIVGWFKVISSQCFWSLFLISWVLDLYWLSDMRSTEMNFLRKRLLKKCITFTIFSTSCIKSLIAAKIW